MMMGRGGERWSNVVEIGVSLQQHGGVRRRLEGADNLPNLMCVPSTYSVKGPGLSGDQPRAGWQRQGVTRLQENRRGPVASDQ